MNIIPFISFRFYRLLLLNIFQKKIKIDSFLFLKYFSYFIGERLCYLTAWFFRSPKIPLYFSGNLVRIYRGKKWKGVQLSKFHVGQRLGVFARTKVLAVFQQAKTKKKKNKNILIKTSVTTFQAKIEKAKKFKSVGRGSQQGLRFINKSLVGSRWLKNTDQIENII